MWPFKSRKSHVDKAIDALPKAIEVASEKWLDFYAQDFCQGMELADIVAVFVEGLEKGLRQWDDFKSAPDGLFLLIAAKGIEKSRTHLRIQIEGALGLKIPSPYERTDEEELAALEAILIERIAEKWTFFVDTIRFTEDTFLKDRIDCFKPPLLEGLRREFPILAESGENDLDPYIALGIDQSGKHSLIEVSDALRLKL